MHQPPCLNEISAACGGGPSSCCLTFPSSTTSTATTKSQSPRSSAASRRDFAAKASGGVFPDTDFTNPESLPSAPESLSQFLSIFPEYHKTHQIDQIRAKQYYHLALSHHTPLDYIGIGLFSHHQFQKYPSSHFFSLSPSSSSSSTLKSLLQNPQFSPLESAIKARIFQFLNVSESDYSMVFTANRTSAFKILSQSYPFHTSNKLVTVYDHESEAVEAMVSSSQNRGALPMAAEFSWPRLRIHSRKLKDMVVSKHKNKKTQKGLFVFPLHSRITGAKYPYLWLSVARENRWHVLVDACALGPKDMDCFGLSIFGPDFVVCSFYKVFGDNPSGFCCLLVKNSVVPILEGNSNSSGVGIVNLVPDDQFCGQISEGKCRGLDQVDSLGLILISTRARCLINWLVSSLMKLKHPNTEGGVNLVKIYGPKVKFERGPALAFNVFDWKGEKVEPVLVQKLADRSNISLAYGFLQNIWFSEKYAEEKGRVLEKRHSCEDDDDGGKKKNKNKGKRKGNLGISVVTAALGFLTNFEDAYKLWAFVAQFLDADFVEKERWRYTALNQRTIIEVL